ncbi:MAG: SDR family NAD(P)-dependent oxidoreductase [Lachnospiraceae bacterium]|nr:SDR family NAD(P)-dependent oxidoreductase [Lachnospiraceae bacterium]
MGRKEIGIVTGATGGIGHEFVKLLLQEQLDEIWIIGRNRERLDRLKGLYGERIIPICMDLTDPSGLQPIWKLLTEEVRVSWLVNNAGMGQMMPAKDVGQEELARTIQLNCQVPAALINGCIPYMGEGSRILNLSSAAAFQPVPYLNLYAATKAFLHSYSRALHMELRPMGITVTSVSPGWVDTDMLERERNGRRIRFPGLVQAQRVAQKAMKDARRGKDVSVCSFYVGCQRFHVKLMPHRLVMRIWMRGIKKYL